MIYDISVIIPAYNAQNTIEKCLITILNQKTTLKYEVIVVNDGSSDKTPQILEHYSEKIKIINQENAGPADARNKGASVAKGEIFVFIDSDCALESNYLHEITLPIIDGYNKNIVGVQGRYKTKQEKAIARFCQQEIEERYNIYKKNQTIFMIGTYAAAYRKDIFLNMGMFDTRFPIASGEDAALSLKIAEHGYKLVFQNTAICYHIHPESAKKYYRQKFSRSYWRNLLYKMYPKKMIKDYYTPQLLKLQVFLSLLIYPQLLILLLSIVLSKELLVIMVTILFTFTAFFISIIPLMILTFKNDPAITVYVPLFSLIRAFALANGLISGFFDLHILKNFYKEKSS